MRIALTLALVGAALVGAPDPTDACSRIGNRMHVLDPAQAADLTAPSGVSTSWVVTTTELEDCGPTGTIQLYGDATDDATPDDKLGYEVRNISHPDISGPDFFVRPDSQLGIMLTFDADELASFTVDFDVAAVDLNGNVGPATPCRAEWINPDPPGGCSTSGGAGWLAGLAIALLALRRRRR